MSLVNAYTHSGRLGAGLFLVPTVGFVSAAVLSVAYAYANVYIPIAGYVSFILTAVFAIGVGMAMSWSAVASKCRNTGFVHLVGFVVSLAALYFAWVSFVFVILQRDFSDDVEVSLIDIALNPGALWEFILVVNENGWYSIGSWTPSGGVLWAFWVIEAITVAVIITFGAAIGVTDRVFCERCSAWCQSEKGVLCLGVPEDDAVVARIVDGDLNVFQELHNVERTAVKSIRVDVDSCEHCGEFATWIAQAAVEKPKKDGETEMEMTALTPRIQLMSEQLRDLRVLADRPVEASAIGESAAAMESGEDTSSL